MKNCKREEKEEEKAPGTLAHTPTQDSDYL
jgi:hypothetical protein